MLRYKSYLIGFLIAIILIWIILFVYVHYGFLDWRADEELASVEQYFFSGSVDRWAARYSPRSSNPMPATDATIAAGIRVYRRNCALCHGSPQQPVSEVGRGLYPRAPQFMRESPVMPENQNYWIIKHGIARSGMPAFGRVLSDAEIWSVVTLLNRYQNIERLWGPSQQDVLVVPPDGTETTIRTPTVAAKPLATTTMGRPSAVVPRRTIVVRPRRRWQPADATPPGKNLPQSPYVY